MQARLIAPLLFVNTSLWGFCFVLFFSSLVVVSEHKGIFIGLMP